MRLLQLLLPDCIHFSCFFPIAFACHYARAVQKYIIGMKVAHHQCSPTPKHVSMHQLPATVTSFASAISLTILSQYLPAIATVYGIVQVLKDDLYMHTQLCALQCSVTVHT